MYLITTSRRPGRKTRRFAKVIARFFNWRYINRGKLSLKDLKSISEDFWIISEVKGNPAIMILFRKGDEVLRMGFTVSNIKKVKMDDSAVVFRGKSQIDPLIFGAVPQTRVGKKLARKVNFTKKVVVRGNLWQFFYGNELLMTMKILYFKIQNSH
ncbi:Brix domain-containing protein [Archaeoglobus neptunius]|uniref:rRNA maturation protein n=1 Tax=Archaeoglobus neptunius TaxID=2798580 RepID=UPI001928D40A|nr:rRNA maturation protein [Archaeoglobus neptunius]